MHGEGQSPPFFSGLLNDGCKGSGDVYPLVREFVLTCGASSVTGSRVLEIPLATSRTQHIKSVASLEGWAEFALVSLCQMRTVIRIPLFVDGSDE